MYVLVQVIFFIFNILNLKNSLFKMNNYYVNNLKNGFLNIFFLKNQKNLKGLTEAIHSLHFNALNSEVKSVVSFITFFFFFKKNSNFLEVGSFFSDKKFLNFILLQKVINLNFSYSDKKGVEVLLLLFLLKSNFVTFSKFINFNIQQH
jgi:hypothetical protein